VNPLQERGGPALKGQGEAVRKKKKSRETRREFNPALPGKFALGEKGGKKNKLKRR